MQIALGLFTKSYDEDKRNEKGIIYALGEVKNLKTAIDYLGKRLKLMIYAKDLETNMQQAYEEGDILCYGYNEENEPEIREEWDAACAAFAINSVFDDNGEAIYALYKKHIEV